MMVELKTRDGDSISLVSMSRQQCRDGSPLIQIDVETDLRNYTDALLSLPEEKRRKFIDDFDKLQKIRYWVAARSCASEKTYSENEIFSKSMVMSFMEEVRERHNLVLVDWKRSDCIEDDVTREDEDGHVYVFPRSLLQTWDNFEDEIERCEDNIAGDRDRVLLVGEFIRTFEKYSTGR
jgi:hypothetical protein